MKKQITINKKIWLSLVAALVILNVLRWWPEGDGLDMQGKQAKTEQKIIKLVVAVPEGYAQPEKGIKRDLFQEQLPERIEAVKKAEPKKKPKRTLPSAEQLAKQKAEADLASIKLIATAQRKGTLQAYLSKGEFSLVVTEGMEFAQDYTVIKITANSIAINHNNTGIQREIKLSE